MAFINAVSSDASATATTIAVTITGQSAGNFGVVTLNWTLLTSSVPSVTDTAGNTWKLIGYNLQINASNSNTALFYCTSLRASASNTITATFPATSTFRYIGTGEWSGISGLFEAEKDAFANSAGPANSGNITTTVANDLLVGFASINGNKFSAVGGGWTLRNNSTVLNEVIMDQTSGAAGSYAATATLSAAQLWDIYILAFSTAPIVTMSPPGGVFDLPTIVTLFCSSPSPSIYYTIDGSAPTTSSTLYTGPFVVQSSCTLNAIATSSGLPNSAVASYPISIGGQIISTNNQVDNTGTRIWAINPNIMFDPVSHKWYMYGNYDNSPGVYQYFTGINCYSSSDLRNWKYESLLIQPAAGSASQTYDRFHCAYNSANTNYVAWARRATFNGTATEVYGPISVFTSPSPTGPFTKISDFATLHTLNTGGDVGLFVDSNGTDAYLIWVANGNGTINIDKLAANWQNIDGVNFTSYTNTAASPFGQTSEAPIMVKQGSIYFWMCSGSSGWTANACLYVTGNSPLGPWTLGGNPFANVVVPQTPQETAISVTPSNTNSYDTQCVEFVQIPGRNGVYYIGDRYDLTIGGGNSSTATFKQYQTIFLPVVFPTSTTMSITWSNNWTFDGAFPTVSGSPAAASGLSVIGSTASWTNNESNPYALYLDASSDSGFTTNVASKVLSQGTNSLTIPLTRTYYRVRTVNANGTSVSQTTTAQQAQAISIPGIGSALGAGRGYGYY